LWAHLRSTDTSLSVGVRLRVCSSATDPSGRADRRLECEGVPTGCT
jgi:hypothetical protein